MKLSIRLSSAALVAVLSLTSSFAQSSVKELHYAFRSVGSESEQMMVNWNGTIIWNSHPNRNELWVQDGGKTLLITDKAILDAMQKATVPLRVSRVSSTADVKKYHEERAKERNAVYAMTNQIVSAAIAKGLGTVAKP